jgi:predicted kinase
MAAEFVVLVGLQASGKSSFCAERFSATHVVVSKDDFPARKREARQRRALEAAFAAQRDVVLDNTNPSRDERAWALERARASGYSAVGYYFESRLAVCIPRNAARPASVRVPEIALAATAARLERPSLEEGFDRLFYVCLREGAFEVAPWHEDR